MLARGDKEEDFGSDEEDFNSLMNSNEDLGHRSLTTSTTVSPKKELASNLTSPIANLDKELEKLLLEEARKQGIYDVDAVNMINYIACLSNLVFI